MMSTPAGTRTLGITTFSITVTKLNIQLNNTQHNAKHCYAESPVMLSVIYNPFMLSVVASSSLFCPKASEEEVLEISDLEENCFLPFF